MAASILNQGKTAIRDVLKAMVTHVGISDDNTAFAAGQTTVNPAGGGTTAVIKAASITDVDANTFRATMSIDSSEFENKSIFTISLLDGSSATDAITRSVRSLGIGVQDGDSFDIGAVVTVEDNS